tara:strand:+ start:1215 stop:1985 length:771 start_codon:yes stop_codon:yes gene_type:complete
MIANFIMIIIFNWLIVTILWIYSQYSKKADIIDTYWGPSFFFVCTILLLNENNFTLINIITSFIVFAWSSRLMIYLHMRNHKKSEDIRYVKIKKKYGNLGMYLISYITQVILIAIVSLPLQVLFVSDLDVKINFISIIGIIISITGIIIESLADSQLTKFKSDNSNDGKVMNKGLWNYSRHPNYFGDSLFWWGIFIISYGVTFNFYVIIAPIAMTYFLLKVSGVSMLENQIKDKKEGYEDYIKTTSSFVIMPKKKR